MMTIDRNGSNNSGNSNQFFEVEDLNGTSNYDRFGSGNVKVRLGLDSVLTSNKYLNFYDLINL